MRGGLNSLVDLIDHLLVMDDGLQFFDLIRGRDDGKVLSKVRDGQETGFRINGTGIWHLWVNSERPRSWQCGAKQTGQVTDLDKSAGTLVTSEIQILISNNRRIDYRYVYLVLVKGNILDREQRYRN